MCCMETKEHMDRLASQRDALESVRESVEEVLGPACWESLPKDLVVRYFAAAGAFLSAAPWRHWSEDDAIEVEAGGLGHQAGECALTGRNPELPAGLVLYRERGDLRELCRLDDTFRGLGNPALLSGPASRAYAEASDEAFRRGQPILARSVNLCFLPAHARSDETIAVFRRVFGFPGGTGGLLLPHLSRWEDGVQDTGWCGPADLALFTLVLQAAASLTPKALEAAAGLPIGENEATVCLRAPKPGTPNAAATPREPFWSVTDEQWGRARSLVDSDSGRGAKPKYGRRAILEGALYKALTGCPWDAMPAKYPPKGILASYLSRWKRAGIWDRLVESQVRDRSPSKSPSQGDAGSPARASQ